MKQLIVLALVLNANQSYELNLKVKNKIQNVSAALWKVLSFMEMYYSEINLDGALGITLTIGKKLISQAKFKMKMLQHN